MYLKKPFSWIFQASKFGDSFWSCAFPVEQHNSYTIRQKTVCLIVESATHNLQIFVHNFTIFNQKLNKKVFIS